VYLSKPPNGTKIPLRYHVVGGGNLLNHVCLEASFRALCSGLFH